MTNAKEIRSAAVNSELLDRAVKALLKHHEATSAKNALLGDEKWVQVQFSLSRVPDKGSPKPIRLDIPYALWKVDEKSEDESHDNRPEPSVCLIVKESSKPEVQELISNFPKEMGLVKKVMGLDSLRKKHARYEQQRTLCSRFDVFLADDRVLPMLAKCLGKAFFKAKKQPIPISVTRRQALPHMVLKSLRSTFMHISTGTCLTIRAGNTSMSSKQLVENVTAIIEEGSNKVPRKLSNIASISIKTADSMALPVYNKSPQELMEIRKLAGLDDRIIGEKAKETKTEDEILVDSVSNKKRKLAQKKSPLLAAVKKLKNSATEKTKNATTEKSKDGHKNKEEMPEPNSEKSTEAISTKNRKRDTSGSHKEELGDLGDHAKETKDKKSSKKAKVVKSKAPEPAPTSIKDSTEKTSSSTPPKARKKAFIPSDTWKGSKKGYVFRRGQKGNGYYVDEPPKVDRMALEALTRMLQSKSGGQRQPRGKGSNSRKNRKVRR